MAVDITSVVLVCLQILIQIVAIYFTYVVYKYNRLNKVWLSVTVALALMTVRRIIALGIELEIFANSEAIEFTDRALIPLAVSTLLLGGLWSMKRSFESFEILEKKVREKALKMGKKKK